jgi:Ca2+-binding EF-hand superfamily protein
LHQTFLRIDSDASGLVDLAEFYRALKLTRCPFADRVFSIMDGDMSGEIDFREFVVAIWNYCSFDNVRSCKMTCIRSRMEGTLSLR